ncbi:MAG: hypothetical protein MK538_18910 [Planctomycetes bacterium]|nr:hypothetical protein [Planctomycetota bacterium]
MTQPPLAFPTEDKRRSSKPFKVLLGAFAAGAITVVLAIQVVVPWLGRRGNLNRFFEDTISSTLNFPVVIESIDTQPLSELTLTRLTAVNAVEAEKVKFSADEVSFYYEPVDLVQGRIARAVMSGPEVFLNLDADLAGVAKLPDITQKTPSVSRVESFLPFTIEETAIQSGKVTLQLLGRQINLGGVKLTFRDLGKRSGQSFRFELEALGATFTAEGRLDLEFDGDATRYVFRHAEINVRDLAIESVWQWLGPSVAIDEPSGIVALEGHLEGVWPDEVRIKLRSKTTNGNANYGSNLQLSEFQSELGIDIRLRDAARTVEFDVQADASAIFHRSAGVTNETLQFVARGRYDTTDQSPPRLQIETLQVNSSQMGRVHLAGIISSREEGRDPSIDLLAQIEDVEPARLVGLLQEKQPSGGADQFALRIKAHLNGTFNEMVADGNVEIVSRARSNPIPVASAWVRISRFERCEAGGR